MKRNSKIALAATAAALPMAGRLLMDGRRSQPGWEKLLDWRYAHRGLYDNDAGIPENSLAAFRRAAEAGFGAELDVHLTADGQLAVIHDSDLQRVCGRAGKVEELTYAELSQLRLLGTEEGIPLLSDVLPLFAGVAPLIVELKPIRGNEPELAEKVCALLDTFPDLAYCLESFDPFAVLWLRKNRPELIRGQLSQNFLRDQDRPKFLVSFLHPLLQCLDPAGLHRLALAGPEEPLPRPLLPGLPDPGRLLDPDGPRAAPLCRAGGRPRDL